MKSMDGVPDADLDKISHLNAMRHFQFDPFSIRPREKCTVGALRRHAADDGVDTSPLSVESRRTGPKDTSSTFLTKRH
jgi:hypothetical protein